MNLNGLNVVSHPLAEKVKRVARINQNPIKKRRRNWQLRYETVRTPCAFVFGNTVYMHPDAYAKLLATTDPSPPVTHRRKTHEQKRIQ